MISNRVKRNICLTLAIMSAICSIDRAIRAFTGNMEWFYPVTGICITAVWFVLWLRYRREVNRGNLFGRVRQNKKKIL